MLDPHATAPVPVRFPACGVFVLESHHDRTFRMPPTRETFAKVLHATSGAGWIVRGGRRTPLAPADVVFVPAGETHHLEDDGARPLSLYVLCVRDLPPEAPRAFQRFAGPLWATEMRQVFRHLLHEQTLARAGHELILRGLALQALGLVRRAAAGDNPAAVADAGGVTQARVAGYVQELERTFFHPQTIDAAARRLGLSRRRFTEVFRAVAGETWLARVQRLRLAHARRLLTETSRSVASIAFECGFEDLSTFYRAFKAAERTSPLAWRTARLTSPNGGKSVRARRIDR
jgi:AraC family L-rhamnose operon regulatory protein RhaS